MATEQLHRPFYTDGRFLILGDVAPRQVLLVLLQHALSNLFLDTLLSLQKLAAGIHECSIVAALLCNFSLGQQLRAALVDAEPSPASASRIALRANNGLRRAAPQGHVREPDVEPSFARQFDLADAYARPSRWTRDDRPRSWGSRLSRWSFLSGRSAQGLRRAPFCVVGETKL